MEVICISMLQKKYQGFRRPGRGMISISGRQVRKSRQMQEQLNVIAGAYPAVPKVGVDGIYGEQTKASVQKFQNIFGLPETGITDYPTWYKIQEIYVAVSRIAELN